MALDPFSNRPDCFLGLLSPVLLWLLPTFPLPQAVSCPLSIVLYWATPFLDKSLGTQPQTMMPISSLQSAGWLGLSAQGRGWLVVPRPWGHAQRQRRTRESDSWGWGHRQKGVCALLLPKLLVSFREHIWKALGHSRPAVLQPGPLPLRPCRIIPKPK